MLVQELLLYQGGSYMHYAYSIQVSHGPKDRAEPHNGLLLSARLGTLDASPGVLRHFCKVPRGEHGNNTIAHARSYCVVVQVDKFCEKLPHFSGHLHPARSVCFAAAQTGSRAMYALYGIQMCVFIAVTRYETALVRSKHSMCYMHGYHLWCLAACWVGTVGTSCGVQALVSWVS